MRHGCCGQRFDFCALGDIGTNGEHVAAHPGKSRAGLFKGVGPDVGNRDSHAAPHCFLRQGKADAAGGAGDGGDRA